MSPVLQQIAWFIAVGTVSAATHWLVVVGLVSATAAPPLLANVGGWLVAFMVSFAGHYTLTFRHQHAPLRQAALRFFGVSALGFAMNEAAYAVLLHTSALPYELSLAAVLIGVAFMTFVLGRFWAFRRATH